MAELLIWIAGGVFTLGAFLAGWIARGRFYAHTSQQALGIRVCAKCGEPIPKGVIRQADGRWLHPHCKGAA